MIFNDHGKQTTLAELRSFAKHALTARQLPKFMVVTASLPPEAMGELARISLAARLALPEWPCKQTTWFLSNTTAAAATASLRPLGLWCSATRSAPQSALQSAMQLVGELARATMQLTDALSMDVPLMNAGMDSIMIPNFAEVCTLPLRCRLYARHAVCMPPHACIHAPTPASSLTRPRSGPAATCQYGRHGGTGHADL